MSQGGNKSVPLRGFSTQFGPFVPKQRHNYLSWNPRKDGENRQHSNPGYLLVIYIGHNKLTRSCMRYYSQIIHSSNQISGQNPSPGPTIANRKSANRKWDIALRQAHDPCHFTYLLLLPGSSFPAYGTAHGSGT